MALERSGDALNRVTNAFFPLLSALSDDEMMEISVEASGKLSDYSTSIILNEGLWKRVKAVWDKRESLNLTPEDKMLLSAHTIRSLFRVPTSSGKTVRNSSVSAPSCGN